MAKRGLILTEICAGLERALSAREVAELCADLHTMTPPRFCRAIPEPGGAYRAALVGSPNPVPGFAVERL